MIRNSISIDRILPVVSDPLKDQTRLSFFLGKLAENSSKQRNNNSNNNYSSDASVKWTYIAIDLLKFSATLGISAYFSYKAFGLIRNLLNVMNSESSQDKESKKLLAKRLNRPDIVNMNFSPHESRLMADVLGSDEISVSFADVGGLEEEVEEVFDSIVFPIQFWNHVKDQGDHRESSHHHVCPTGVLLFGAPGTGKTLIAKAIAKGKTDYSLSTNHNIHAAIESGATFINIKASSVMDKWFGESDRLVSALFSLARKLGPSIIFIDEIETLLRKRNGSLNNPALTTLQGVFLTEWDGLNADRKEVTPATSSGTPLPPHSAKPETIDAAKKTQTPPVVVLGATNRPGDIDAAFLRRMPVQIRTHMPNSSQRESILRAMLRDEQVSSEVSLVEIAQQTEGYSGSDLRELVRLATLQRMRDVKQSFRQEFMGSTSSKNDLFAKAAMNKIVSNHKETFNRSLQPADFDFAYEKTRHTVQGRQVFNEEVHEEDSRSLSEELKNYVKLASTLSALSSQTSRK